MCRVAVDQAHPEVIGLVARDMQIRVLGPVEASVDDRPVTLGGAKLRAVLAMLGLEANRAVTADRLIEGLWGSIRRRAPPRWSRTTSGGCAGCWVTTAAP